MVTMDSVFSISQLDEQDHVHVRENQDSGWQPRRTF